MSESDKIKLQKKKLKEKANWWKLEVKKRKDFGISSEPFYLAFGRFPIPFYSIRHKADFESLAFKFREYKMNIGTTANARNNRKRLKHFIDEFKKYKEYTFKQLEDAGGALKLSETCEFVHIIIKEKLEYKGKKIEIYYREKDAVNSNKYPIKVKEVFVKNRHSMAVAFLFNEAPTRSVIFGKNLKIKENIEEIMEDIMDGELE